MKTFQVGLCIIAATVALVTIYLVRAVSANNEYANKIQNHWTLADRASTIEAKREHIKSFVNAIENSNIQDEHDAIFFENPENSAFHNLEAVKSLAQRLDQIKDMNPSSFEYQTAIQQITAQEQGEAQNMLRVLENCWMKKYHWFYWKAGIIIMIVIFGIMAILGIMLMGAFDL